MFCSNKLLRKTTEYIQHTQTTVVMAANDHAWQAKPILCSDSFFSLNTPLGGH